MGVDITHIVRHDFYNLEDRDLAIKYVMDTIHLLKSKLALDEDIESFEFNVDDDYNEITFRPPLYDVEFTLHKGFWQIESYVHYCQIVMHTGDKFWLREMISDVARVLGQKEVWHAQEFYTWNGGTMEDTSSTFDEWISFVKGKFGGEIPEYDYNAIMAQGDVLVPNYEPVYHDSLKECDNKLRILTDRLDKAGYEPIGLLDMGGYKRCRRKSDGSIHLVNMDTLEPMIEGTPEAYYFDFKSAFFVVKQYGKYALFDIREGRQITPYVSEHFRQEWSKEYNANRIINDEAGVNLATY